MVVSRRRVFTWVAVLYFLQGFPFAWVKDVLPVYLRMQGVSLVEIGLLSLLGLPWTLKFLWAPLVDFYGSYMRWVQASLCVMAAVSLGLPVMHQHTWALAVLLMVFVCASATQDIAIDAYSVSLLSKGDEGYGNSIRSVAYRAAMIAVGGGFLLLIERKGVGVQFYAMALLAVCGAMCVFLAPKLPKAPTDTVSYLQQFKTLWAQKGVWSVCAFIALYKLGDASLGPMIKPFWLDRGLAASEIAWVSTSLGVLCTLGGAVLGGWCIHKNGLYPSLWWLGAAQMLSNAVYAYVATFPHADTVPSMVFSGLDPMLDAVWSVPIRRGIYAASLCESFTGGLGTAAFMAFLMRLAKRGNPATLYAVLSAVFALSRDMAGALSGFLTQHMGYASYFTTTVLLSFPAFLLLPHIRSWLYDETL